MNIATTTTWATLGGSLSITGAMIVDPRRQSWFARHLHALCNALAGRRRVMGQHSRHRGYVSPKEIIVCNPTFTR